MAVGVGVAVDVGVTVGVNVGVIVMVGGVHVHARPTQAGILQTLLLQTKPVLQGTPVVLVSVTPPAQVVRSKVVIA